ncbi:MAG: beta-amylase [Flavobacteriales bacterium]|jgi:beta-amylase
MNVNTTIKKMTILIAGLLCLSLLGVSHAYAGKANTTNVMAPLEVFDWWAFDQQLTTAKNMGMNGVSVDVWWGKVEGAGDQIFDWSYYDTLVQHIENAGLHWVPIMSFHQCGGNVGDTCDIPIPGWIWTHYPGVDANDMKYRSEQYNYSVETVSLWQDALVMSEYEEFMNAFEDHFASKAYMTDEVNISMGPAGELRYPSYNSHDSGTGYPTRGAFQSYSEPAKADFRRWALDKYRSLNAINSAWGFSLASTNDINPPANANQFISDSDHYDMQYGRDFVRWYHESLKQHGVDMMDTAATAFSGAFNRAELGYKIPGIHWQMGIPNGYSRSAEIAAGLIPSDVDLNAGSTAHGYESIIGVAGNDNNTGRNVVLHFTALEMDNQNWSPQYSKAKDLVFWMANGAAAQNVSIKGENALAGGVTTDTGWNNIENAFNYASYSGMTVLRIGNVATGGTGQNRYSNFIQNFHDRWYFSGSPNGWSPWDMVQISSTKWEMTATFAANGVFKIRHSNNNWNESYPNNNWGISQGAGTYKITFDSSDQSIQVVKQ